jgi:CBS domain-containing protein
MGKFGRERHFFISSRKVRRNTHIHLGKVVDFPSEGRNMAFSAGRAAVERESMGMVQTISEILKTKGSQVWSLGPEATVYEAIAVMAEKRIGALLVMAQGKLAGIVSERDYARKVILKGHSSRETRVEEIMTSRVLTVTPQHTVAECMKIMTESRIRHLPVLEGENLAGVISIGDIVNAIMSAQADTIQHLSNYITGEYPA